MTNCPTCGQTVPEGQRFCGNCGTDVQAASTYRATQNPLPSAPPLATNTYGYGQSTYDYAPLPPRRPFPLTTALIVISVAILCLCCGLVAGAAGMYWLGPVPTPAPAPIPTHTPEALNLWINLLIV